MTSHLLSSGIEWLESTLYQPADSRLDIDVSHEPSTDRSFKSIRLSTGNSAGQLSFSLASAASKLSLYGIESSTVNV